MKLPLVLLLVSTLFSASALAREFCNPSSPCWPSQEAWSCFNTTIDGHLVASHPPAWSCHDPNYDKSVCANAQSNWNNSFWRTNQTGAMQDLIWDSPSCGIDSPRNETCVQGSVPVYSVIVHGARDVSAALEFAKRYNVRVVVKNTGHDYLGRSSGAGSLGIWTHRLKGVDFTSQFVADGCVDQPNIPAVTLGAAEQWLDVYKAADENNVTIVGGAANSVGAAGGWLNGGGHGLLASMYGLGVDNVLQFTIVKPDGSVVKANTCRNKDLFWALRGGGGGTWGVTLDVTYRTHPPLKSIVAMDLMINTTSPQQLVQFTDLLFRSLPNITDRGVRGFGSWSATNIVLTIVHPQSPDISTTNNTLQPLFTWATQNAGTQISSTSRMFASYYDFHSTWITGDVSIATSLWVGGRLVSRDAFIQNSTQLVDLMVNVPEGMSGGGINFIGGGAISQVDPSSTALNPQWRRALVSWNPGAAWNSDTPQSTIEKLKASTTDFVQRLGHLAGLDHAAYLNEADPDEPLWKQAFFGDHYERLLEIKNTVDPEGVFTCNRCVGSDL